MQRIAVSGKGGSGKTTIAGTLARLSGRKLGHVLAVDGDPNPNLGRAMGILREGPWPLLPPDTMKVEEIDGKKVSRLGKPIREILATHSITGPDGVRLLALGEVEASGKGCLCSRHAMVREIVGAAMEEANEPVVLDMEASLEHMRRGTVKHVDKLLVVTEPYYRALESAGRLVRLARELGLAKIYAVANKVRSPTEEEVIKDYFANLEVPIIAIIPFDDSVTEADLEGKAVIDHAPNGAVVKAVDGMLNRLMA
ncbi:MAG: AAA family ATPase [Deinococcus sp.]|mgnify:CR=1 FL=1|nr:AAA family ATPase [Deinococcus sp.]MCL5964635.1 AAA family ATPase [Deinococcus sp.]